MKEITIENLKDYIQKEIVFQDTDGERLKATVQMSMGGVFLINHKNRIVGWVMNGKKDKEFKLFDK